MSPSMTPFTPLTLLSILFLAISQVSAKIPKEYCMEDPYAFPELDLCNQLKYIATNSYTAVSFTLVLLVGLILATYIVKWGGKFMAIMVLGCIGFAAGLGLRFGLNMRPQSMEIYISYYLLVVLSPCAFIAANYMLLGRFASSLGMEKHLLVPVHLLTKVFVASDFVTFVIQAVGGGLSGSATSVQMYNSASQVFFASLILQLISFAAFTVIFGVWLYRIYKEDYSVWIKDSKKPFLRDWRSLAVALAISCTGILVRSIFRTVELAQGFHGYLATHEVYFYALDTVPLFTCIVVYTVVWPGRFISDHVHLVKTSEAKDVSVFVKELRGTAFDMQHPNLSEVKPRKEELDDTLP